MDNIILDNVKTALEGLDIELKCRDGLYEFEYKDIPLFLSIDEETQSVAFLTLVADLGKGRLNKDSLEKAFHEVEHYYKYCHADWCDGEPYLASPHFPLKEDGMAATEWKEELEDFRHSYFFLMDHIYNFSGMEDTGTDEEEEDRPSDFANDIPSETSEHGKDGNTTGHSLMDKGELKEMAPDDFTDFLCIDFGCVAMPVKTMTSPTGAGA